MSNIDKQALREAAEKATDSRARLDLMESVFDDDGDVTPEAQDDISICMSFNDLTNPSTVLALLDELEAKDKAWSAQDNHINQQADRIESLEKKNGDLGRALGAAEKRTAELLARDISIKQHAQALFEAIANPSDHYVPAYARCLREALNGTSTGKGE